MLSACLKMGQVGYARELFDEMPRRDVAVWNAMITGCMENGCEEIGIGLFREMHCLGVRHDKYSFGSILSACTVELMDFGKQVHSMVIKTGFLSKASVINALITMSFNCKDASSAFLVFEGADALVRDQITFNVMIDGLGSLERVEEALMMWRKMLEACLRPTELTFISLMGSCSNEKIGRQVHAQVIKSGFKGCTSVGNAIITMYSNCGNLREGYMVFACLEEKDLVSWNTMISSYAIGKSGRSAIWTYQEMHRTGIKPDEFTFGSLLVSTESIETVEMIQALVFRYGLISKIEVSNALISAYSKHGEIEQAYQIFHTSQKNLISWNTIISGLLLNGLPIHGLEQFSNLLISELKPNPYSISIILSICANISSLRIGKQVHGYILRHQFFETSLGNALITMYTKCGILDWSLRVFDKMVEKDIVSWNALISAYAQHGEGMKAVHSFKAMQNEGKVKPDCATFTAILSACSHSGLVDEGAQIFNSMVNDYGYIPEVDQMSCMVDLLARAGFLDEAESIINSQEIEAQSNLWWALFSACAAHGNLKLGRIVARFLLEQEKNNPSVYVLLSNIYASVGQWKEAAHVRELMKSIGVKKKRGSSWIRS